MKAIVGVQFHKKESGLLCASFTENGEDAFCLYKCKDDSFSEEEVLVRIHSGCITSEVFGMEICDCKWQLDYSIELIEECTNGLVIYLPKQEGKSNGLFNKIRSFEYMKKGLPLSDIYKEMGLPSDARSYKFAFNILRYFNIRRIALITNNPLKLSAFEGSDFIITKRIPALMPAPNLEIRNLLQTKKLIFNHYID